MGECTTFGHPPLANSGTFFVAGAPKFCGLAYALLACALVPLPFFLHCLVPGKIVVEFLLPDGHLGDYLFFHTHKRNRLDLIPRENHTKNSPPSMHQPLCFTF